MIRGAAIQRLDHDPEFSWRGDSVTRIENLSDIVFALAFGMLVSASAPPQTFPDLGEFLVSIVPVTAAFALMVGLWNSHFTFFRRYGLADGWIVFLNAVLLFIVLYIAYPLRFAFDGFFGYILLVFGAPERVEAMQIGYRESGIIMAYFTIGYGAIHLLFTMMYAHALSRKDMLSLNATEIAISRRSLAIALFAALLSFAIAGVALMTPLYGFAGFFMLLILPAGWLIGRLMRPPASAPD